MSQVDICTSKAQVKFSDYIDQTRIKSDTFSVPEIKAKWWLEMSTTNSTTTFMDHFLPPRLTFTIKFLHQAVVKSKQFSVTIKFKEHNFLKFANNQTQSLKVSEGIHAIEASCDTFLVNQANVVTFHCSIAFKYHGGKSSLARKFNWMLPGTAISHRRVLDYSVIDSLYGDPTFADFKFNVRGKEFKVHKNLLSAASEVFKTMFTCGLDETKNNSATEDCDPEIFEHFIKFIYTDIVPEDEMPAISHDLYALAHRYGINALMETCMEFILAEEIADENAVELYEFASTYEIEVLLDATWEYIKKNMLNLFRSCSPKPVSDIRVMLEEKASSDARLESFTIAEKAAYEAKLETFAKSSKRKSALPSSAAAENIKDAEELSQPPEKRRKKKNNK